MPDPNFQFNPPDGHNNTVEFKTNPDKTAVRGYMQRLHDQTRDFINITLIPWINATFSAKTEVLTRTNTDVYTPTASTHPATKKYVDDTTAGVVLGQIPDGTVTDAKLSNTAGQIKDTVTTHMAENLNYKRITSMGGMA